jgi:hypothetical protein
MDSTVINQNYTILFPAMYQFLKKISTVSKHAKDHWKYPMERLQLLN